MTNKLTLEQILEVVKKKYPEAEIKEEDQYSIISKHNSIYYVSYNNKRIWPNDFDNIIELKHYLGLDIEWEDLKEYAKNKNLRIDTTILSEKDEYIYVVGNQLFKNKDIANYCDRVENRSYWQMYQIISSLTS